MGQLLKPKSNKLVTYDWLVSLLTSHSDLVKSARPNKGTKTITYLYLDDYFNTSVEDGETKGLYVKYSVLNSKTSYKNILNLIERDIWVNEGSTPPTPSSKYTVKVKYDDNGTLKWLDKTGVQVNAGENYEKDFSSAGLTFSSVTSDNNTPCSVNGSIINAGPINSNTILIVEVSGGTPSEDTSITWQVNAGLGEDRTDYNTVISGPTSITPGTEFSYNLGTGETFKWVYVGDTLLTTNYFYNESLRKVTIYSEATSGTTDNVIIYVEREEALTNLNTTFWINDPLFTNGLSVDISDIDPRLVDTTGYTIAAIVVNQGLNNCILIDNNSNTAIHVNSSGLATITMSKDNLSYTITLFVSAVVLSVTLNSSYNVRTGDIIDYTIVLLDTSSNGTLTLDTSLLHSSSSYNGYILDTAPGALFDSNFEFAGANFKWTVPSTIRVTSILLFYNGLGSITVESAGTDLIKLEIVSSSYSILGKSSNANPTVNNSPASITTTV